MKGLIILVIFAVGLVTIGLWAYRKVNPATPTNNASGGAGSASFNTSTQAPVASAAKTFLTPGVNENQYTLNSFVEGKSVGLT